jgi:hypothetical protein
MKVRWISYETRGKEPGCWKGQAVDSEVPVILLFFCRGRRKTEEQNQPSQGSHAWFPQLLPERDDQLTVRELRSALCRPSSIRMGGSLMLVLKT